MIAHVKPSYPSVRGWLGTAWALHPPTCKTCGQRKLMSWGRDVKAGHWLARCLACRGPLADKTFSRAEDEPKLEIIASVVEVSVLLASQPGRPDLPVAPLSIWVRDGYTLDASQVAGVGQSFLDLAKARLFKAKNPGRWALELRDDGRVWSPWDPVGGGATWRRGSPMALRSKTLRSSKWSRSCWGCKAKLGEGATAWCPDTAGGHDWSGDGAKILFCPPCVAAVRTAAQDVGGESSEQVRHLRVFEGGAHG